MSISGEGHERDLIFMSMRNIHTDECMNCNSCVMACAVEHSQSKSLFGAVEESTPVVSRIRFQANGNSFTINSCLHCNDAPCIGACPVGALKRDPDFKTVFINYSECNSCGICSRKCPEKAIIFFNSKVYKCDGCLERRKRGETPACILACPTGAIKLIFPNR